MSSTGRIWRVTRRLLAAGGVVFVTGRLIQVYGNYQKQARLPERFVLELDFDNTQIVETPGGFDFQEALRGAVKKLELKQVVEAVGSAGKDERVKGMLVSCGSEPGVSGLAQAQELRQAFQHFRQQAAGRAACIAFADSFGEAGAFGTLPYYMAAACDKVYLQPTGLLSATGLAVQTPFLRTLLDKWKIQATVIKREEYKNAANSITETDYTPAHRQATEQLLRSFMSVITSDIAIARNLTQAEVRAAVDVSPLTCPQALQRKLVDAAKYRDEALLEAKGVKKAVVALIRASGQIYAGQGPPQGLQSEPVIAAKPLCQLLDKAGTDEAIRAVVLRIDSPGGSAVASDTIHRQVQRLRDSGRVVVVSMGNLAASGGYYVAAPAHAIVAEPGTITGSIGVISAKLDVEGLLNDQGVNVSTIQEGQNAAAVSLVGGLTEEQLKQMNELVDWIYGTFVDRVASGRGMAVETVRELAKGRVWSGQDALQHNLVDALGGLTDAVRLAKALADLPVEDEAAVQVKEITADASPLQRLLKSIPGTQDLSLSSAAHLLAGLSQSPELSLPPDVRWAGSRLLKEARQSQAGPQLLCTLSAEDIR
ncbi:hypothetical protein WJX73_006007 [Symbiochloris irregularis]|uniref:Peptidase S49 domain-containing protein n=1 Tax=Symbiochloris irregularis TaxID=706552 RepID=A0AAW1PR52_9CHLO